VKGTFPIAAVNVVVGRIARLRGSPQEGPESGRKPPFHLEREWASTAVTERSCLCCDLVGRRLETIGIGAQVGHARLCRVPNGRGRDFRRIAAGATCIVYQPIYDDAGNYLGSNPVNVCQ
jgi:hypothetical protein